MPYITELTVFGEAELKDMLRIVISKEGKAVIKDDKQKLIAILKDKATGFPNQVTWIETALTQQDIIQLLLVADDGDDAEKFNAIDKMINGLIDKLGMQRTNAIEVASYLAFGFDWNITIIKNFAMQLYRSVTDSSQSRADVQEDKQFGKSTDKSGENESKRSLWKRNPFKSSGLNLLFWDHQIAFIVAFCCVVCSIVLFSLGIWKTGIIALVAALASALLFDMVSKKWLGEAVDEEVQRGFHIPSAQDEIEKSNFILNQADYFAFKVSPNPTDKMNMLVGFIKSQSAFCDVPRINREIVEEMISTEKGN
jgi:hypothetical protein